MYKNNNKFSGTPHNANLVNSNVFIKDLYTLKSDIDLLNHSDNLNKMYSTVGDLVVSDFYGNIILNTLGGMDFTNIPNQLLKSNPEYSLSRNTKVNSLVINTSPINTSNLNNEFSDLPDLSSNYNNLVVALNLFKQDR